MHVASREETGGRRSFLLVLDADDEVMGTIEAFAREEGLEGASLTALGALREAVLAFWDPQTRLYDEHALEGQMEVASLLGNVARGPDGGMKVHAHAVLGARDATARAGHLVRGVVRPTLEVRLVETGTPLRRGTDERTGLPLLQPG